MKGCSERVYSLIVSVDCFCSTQNSRFPQYKGHLYATRMCVLQGFVCVTIATKTVGVVAEKCKPSLRIDLISENEPRRALMTPR